MIEIFFNLFENLFNNDKENNSILLALILNSAFNNTQGI